MAEHTYSQVLKRGNWGQTQKEHANSKVTALPKCVKKGQSLTSVPPSRE